MNRSTRKITFLCVWGISFLVLLVSTTYAQSTFVYTNDDRESPQPNTVSGFAVASNGALTPIPGSPFVTGCSTGPGFGGTFAINRIVVIGNRLYASNKSCNNVSGFSINTTTGVLSSLPGSPYSTGGSGGEGISLAVTPDGGFLVAGNSGSNDLTVFAIKRNGMLTPVSGSPFPAGGALDGVKVLPNGQFLAVGLQNSGVAMFSISSDGALSPVPGSPFVNGTAGASAGVDANCSSTLLFVGEANISGTIVDVLQISDSGFLDPVPGSPFMFNSGINSNNVLLSPNQHTLFVSNNSSNTVTALTINPAGHPTLVPGSPFPVGGGPFFTVGLAINPAGTLLYTASLFDVLNEFGVATNGRLTLLATASIGGFGFSFLESVAVFPAPVCPK